MIWVVLLLVLAVALGGAGLIVDAVQWLFTAGLVLAAVALGIGLWVGARMSGR